MGAKISSFQPRFSPRNFNNLKFLQDFDRQPPGKRDIRGLVLIINAITDGNGGKTAGGIGKPHLQQIVSELRADEQITLATHRDLTRETLSWLAESGAGLSCPDFQFAVETRLFASGRQTNGAVERCAQGFAERAQNGSLKVLVFLGEEIADAFPQKIPPVLQDAVATAMIVAKRKRLKDDPACAARATEVLRNLDARQRQSPYRDLVKSFIRDVQIKLLSLSREERAAVLEELKESRDEILYYETLGLFRLEAFIQRFSRLTPGKRELAPLALFINEVADARKKGQKVRMLTQVVQQMPAREKQALAFHPSLSAGSLRLLRERSEKIPDGEDLQLITLARLWARGIGVMGRVEWDVAGKTLEIAFNERAKTRDPLLFPLSQTLLREAEEIPENVRRSIGNWAETISVQSQNDYEIARAIAILIVAEGSIDAGIAYKLQGALVGCDVDARKSVYAFLEEGAPSCLREYARYVSIGVPDEAIALDIIDQTIGVPAMRRLIPAKEREELTDEAVDRKVLLAHPDAVLRQYGCEQFQRMLSGLLPEEKKAVLTHPHLAPAFFHESAFYDPFDMHLKELYYMLITFAPDLVIESAGVDNFRRAFDGFRPETKQAIAQALAERLPERPLPAEKEIVALLLWVGEEITPAPISQKRADYFSALAKAIPAPEIAERAAREAQILADFSALRANLEERWLAIIRLLAGTFFDLPAAKELQANAPSLPEVMPDDVATAAKEVAKEDALLAERIKTAEEDRAIFEESSRIRALITQPQLDLTAAQARLESDLTPSERSPDRLSLNNLRDELRRQVDANRAVENRTGTIDALLAAEDLDEAAAEKLLADKFKPKKRVVPVLIDALVTAEAVLRGKLAANKSVRETITAIHSLLAADQLDQPRAERMLAENCPAAREADRKSQQDLAAAEKTLQERIAANRAVLQRIHDLRELLSLSPFDREFAEAVLADSLEEKAKADPALQKEVAAQEAAAQKAVINELLQKNVNASLARIRSITQATGAAFDLAAARAQHGECSKLLNEPDLPLSAREELKAALDTLKERTKTEQSALDEAKRTANREIKSLTKRLESAAAQLRDSVKPSVAEKAEALLKEAEAYVPHPVTEDHLQAAFKKNRDELKTTITAAQARIADAEKAKAAIAAPPIRAAAPTPPAPRSPGIANLNQALEALSADPHNARLWDKVLTFAAQSLSARSKKGPPHKEKLIFRKLTLSAPELNAAEADKIAASLGPEYREKLAEIYLAEGDREEAIATSFQLYASAGLLGSTGAPIRTRKLRAIQEDISLLSNLAERAHWNELITQLESTEAELDILTFELLKARLGLAVARGITQPFAAFPLEGHTSNLMELIMSAQPRRLPVPLLNEIRQRMGEEITAHESGGKKLPFSRKRGAFYYVVFASCNLSLGPDHPEFDAARERFPELNDVNTLFLSFNELCRAGLHSRAAAAGERMLAERHDNQEIILNVGKAYAYCGKYKEAIRHFAQLPPNINILNLLLVANNGIGDLDAAEKAGKRALQISHPEPEPADRAITHLYLAGTYFKRGNFNAAEFHYKKALELNMATESVFRNLTLTCLGRFMGTNDPASLTAAFAVARKYAQAHPENPEPHSLLANCYWRNEEPAEAAREGELALALARGNPNLDYESADHFLFMAGVNMALKDAASTAKYLSSFLRYHYAEAHLENLIRAYAESGDLSRALSALETASAIFPGDHFRWDLQTAYCLKEQGKYAEARTLYEKLLAEAPQDESVLFHFGTVLTLQGDAHQARPLLAQISRGSANYLQAQINLTATEESCARGVALWEEIPPEKTAERVVLALNLNAAYKKRGDNAQAAVWEDRVKALDPGYTSDNSAQTLDKILAGIKAEPGENMRWEFLYKHLESHPEHAPAVIEALKAEASRINFSLVHRAALAVSSLDFVLENCFPLSDPLVLRKFISDLMLADKYSEALDIIGRAPAALREDPKIQLAESYTCLGLKQYDRVLALSERYLPAMEENSRPKHQMLRLRARAFEKIGRQEEARILYQQLLHLPPSDADIELDARIGTAAIVLAESTDPLAVEKVLRSLRPVMRRVSADSDNFQLLVDFMGKVPEDQAEEISWMIQANLQTTPGGLLDALEIILPLARKEGTPPVIKRLAKALEKKHYQSLDETEDS